MERRDALQLNANSLLGTGLVDETGSANRGLTMPKIFISHKHDDADMAERVYSCIKKQPGYDAYMVAVDDKEFKEDRELATKLRDEISKCQRIIAVISDHTKLSWWVPWEIGVGYGKNYNMASYIEDHRDSLDLPSYIEDWPILNDLEGVRKYCELSANSSAGSSQRSVLMEARGDTTSQPGLISSDEFHKQLKTWLIERRRS